MTNSRLEVLVKKAFNKFSDYQSGVPGWYHHYVFMCLFKHPGIGNVSVAHALFHRELLLNGEIPRLTSCELEVDVVSADIINRLQIEGTSDYILTNCC